MCVRVLVRVYIYVCNGVHVLMFALPAVCCVHALMSLKRI